MNNLEHKTTEEHYNKYRDMANSAGIRFNTEDYMGYMGYMGFTKEQLLKLYIEDNLLNNIPLRDFDSFYFFYLLHTKNIITNLADNVCVLKHLLIYEVLEAIPIFVDGKKYGVYPPY